MRSTTVCGIGPSRERGRKQIAALLTRTHAFSTPKRRRSRPPSALGSSGRAAAAARQRASFGAAAACACGGMKLKQLQALLEDVEPFAKPKVALEQYVTGARPRRV